MFRICLDVYGNIGVILIIYNLIKKDVTYLKIEIPRPSTQSKSNFGRAIMSYFVSG